MVIKCSLICILNHTIYYGKSTGKETEIVGTILKKDKSAISVKTEYDTVFY